MATFISLGLVTLAYVLMAASLTLLLPYDQINPSAAFADAFEVKGLIVAKYVVAVGALLGMLNNQVRTFVIIINARADDRRFCSSTSCLCHGT